MTVSSEINKSGPYTGNGVTTVFAYGFRILDASHIEVIRTEGGIDTTVSPSAYSVSGVGSASGNVVFSVAPASGQSITIIRNVPFTQSTDLENQGAYYAETIEQSLDLAAMRDQQLAEELSRAVKVPVGRAPLDTDEVVEGLLRFSDIYQGASDGDLSVRVDGSALEGGDLYYNNLVGEYRFWDGSSWVPFYVPSYIVTYRYIATSGQTVFSGADLNGLTPTSMQSGAILVHINGLSIIEGVDFEIGGGGSIVTLTTGAAVSDEIVITEFKQIQMSQLPAQVANDAAAAEAARIAAEATALALHARFYGSLAEFNSAVIPAVVNTVVVSVDTDDIAIFSRSSEAAGPGDLTHSSGQVWRRATVTQADVDEAVAGAVAPLNVYAGAPGTFTPGITFASPGTLSVSYGYRYGWYQRVGNTVFAAVNINPATITKGTASGNLRISFSDLPFTPSASSMGSGVIRAKNQYLVPPAGAQDLTLLVVPGQKYVEIAGLENSGGMNYLTASNVLNGDLILQLRFQFEVAAVSDDDPAVHPGYFAFTRAQLEAATGPVAYGQNLILVLEGGYAVPYIRTPFATDLICGDMSTWAKAGITVSDAVQIGTEVANSVASLSDGLRNIPDGNAAAPGWKFSLDSDTGVYRPGSNQIGFATNGVSRAVLSDTGLSVSVPVTGDAVQQSDTDVTPGRLMRADYGYSRGNILGTVSQSSGIPTGAVIESGNVAGGRYIMYADGTMICWHVIGSALTANVQIGATGIYRPSVPYTWTFPREFVGVTPHVTGSSRTYLEIGYGRGMSTTQGNIDICRIGSAATAASAIEMMAVGRWY